MTKRYHLSSFIKIFLILVIPLILYSTIRFYNIDKYTSIEFPGGIIPFLVIDVIVIILIIRRIITPLVEISDTGIKVSLFPFKKSTARWEEIEGMTINYISSLGIKERQVKILVRTEGSSIKEMVFNMKAVEKPEEIVETLRAKIPEKGFEDIRKSPILQKPVNLKEVVYRGWTATERGLASKQVFIPWDMIKELKYPAFVIGGYGATTLNYISAGGMKRHVTIKASASDEYLAFLRYLIQHSYKAVIDPGLVKALDYSPKDAKTDMVSSMLLILGIIMLFILPTVICYYSTGIYTGYLNAMLLIPFGIMPLAMTMKSLMRRSRGEPQIESHKMLWPILSATGPIIAVLIFFILSPFSFYWLSGSIAKKTGNFALAERYYQTSLEYVPGNIDVLYDLGKLYLKEEKYEQALTYLKQAYTKDPTWWGPKAVILVPDTLMKMKKYDEALQWCEQVLKDRPNKIDIAQAISRKQDEIISEKSFHERQNVPKEPDIAALNQPATPVSPPVKQQTPATSDAPEKEAAATEVQKTEPQTDAKAQSTIPQLFPSKKSKINRLTFIIIVTIIYIYFCLCLFLIAKKLQLPAPWMAWLPFANMWTSVSAAGKSWWWILLLIIPYINILASVYIWMCISENLGKNKFLGLLMLLPFINLVFMGVLAFSANNNE